MAASCAKCGKPIDPGWAFCPACGQRIEAPPPAPSLPIVSLSADAQGACALIRTTGGEIDVARVGKLIATATGLPLADVTAQIKRSKGFLVREVDADVGRVMLPELEKLGAPAMAVPLGHLLPLPPIARARQPRIKPEGIGTEASLPGAEPRELWAPWAHVLLISAARVHVDVTHVEQVEDTGPGGSNWRTRRAFLGPRKHEKVISQPGFDWLIDVFVAEPSCILRLRDERFSFDTMQRLPGERSAMVRLADELRRSAPNVPRSSAFEMLFDDARHERWPDYTYLALSTIDDYNQWLYNLARMGLPIP